MLFLLALIAAPLGFVMAFISGTTHSESFSGTATTSMSPSPYLPPTPGSTELLRQSGMGSNQVYAGNLPERFVAQLSCIGGGRVSFRAGETTTSGECDGGVTNTVVTRTAPTAAFSVQAPEHATWVVVVRTLAPGEPPVGHS